MSEPEDRVRDWIRFVRNHPELEGGTVAQERPRAVRPAHIEPDPRTDGVGDGGKRELPPPPEEEIRAGVEQERARQVAADDSEWPAQ